MGKILNHARHFQQPSRRQLDFKKGDWVMHESLGIGKLKEEWQSWKSCRVCYRENCDRHGESNSIQVSSHGVFDVEFASGKTHAVNRIWLQPL